MAYTAPANFADSSVKKDTDAGAMHAYGILHFAFAAIPIVSGIDKFSDLLTNWDRYLAPVVTTTLGVNAHMFMQIVGAVEILAGLIVAFRPRIGAYVVAAWLAGIIANLALNPIHYWDVAVRDFGLLLGALSLGSLSAWAKHKN